MSFSKRITSNTFTSNTYTIGALSRFVIVSLFCCSLTPVYKLGYYMSLLWIIRAVNLLVILPRKPALGLSYISVILILSQLFSHTFLQIAKHRRETQHPNTTPRRSALIGASQPYHFLWTHPPMRLLRYPRRLHNPSLSS
jgi:hypothetical protein